MQEEKSNEESSMENTQSRKLMSQLDARGYFVGPVWADASPLDEPGYFLIPGGAIDREPPNPVEPERLYRPAGDAGWMSVEDFRQRTFYLTRDGEAYGLGEESKGQRYDGIGPLPNWLTFESRPNAWSVWNGLAWTLDDALFSLEITRRRSEEKREKLLSAGLMIAPLLDAFSLGIATQEELILLDVWKQYRVELSRVDPADHEAGWPVTPG